MENRFYVYATEEEFKKFQLGKEALAFFNIHKHSFNQNEKWHALSVTMEECYSRFRNGTTYIKKKSDFVEYA